MMDEQTKARIGEVLWSYSFKIREHMNLDPKVKKEIIGKSRRDLNNFHFDCVDRIVNLWEKEARNVK